MVFRKGIKQGRHLECNCWSVKPKYQMSLLREESLHETLTGIRRESFRCVNVCVCVCALLASPCMIWLPSANKVRSSENGGFKRHENTCRRFVRTIQRRLNKQHGGYAECVAVLCFECPSVTFLVGCIANKYCTRTQ